MRAPQRPRVFNQITFFGMLIPGLFAFSVILLLLPSSVSETWLAGVAILLPVSFSLGVIANVTSKWIVRDTRYKFRNLVAIDSTDNGMEVDLAKTFLDKVGDGDIWERSDLDFDPSNRTITQIPMFAWLNRFLDGQDQSGDEARMLYRHMLNTVWNNPSGFSRMDVSIVIMCRSMVAMSIILIPIVIIGTGCNLLESPAVYESLFSSGKGLCSDHYKFIAVSTIVLVVNAFVFHKSYRYFSGILIEYAMLEYIRMNEEPGHGPTEFDRRNPAVDA